MLRAEGLELVHLLEAGTVQVAAVVVVLMVFVLPVVAVVVPTAVAAATAVAVAVQQQWNHTVKCCDDSMMLQHVYIKYLNMILLYRCGV